MNRLIHICLTAGLTSIGIITIQRYNAPKYRYVNTGFQIHKLEDTQKMFLKGYNTPNLTQKAIDVFDRERYDCYEGPESDYGYQRDCDNFILDGMEAKLNETEQLNN